MNADTAMRAILAGQDLVREQQEALAATICPTRRMCFSEGPQVMHGTITWAPDKDAFTVHSASGQWAHWLGYAQIRHDNGYLDQDDDAQLEGVWLGTVAVEGGGFAAQFEVVEEEGCPTPHPAELPDAPRDPMAQVRTSQELAAEVAAMRVKIDVHGWAIRHAREVPTEALRDLMETLGLEAA